MERLTSTRLSAVLLGALVTAVIQSSSATTVMVVGFVNSGIMQLCQAVGFIIGANVGTTVTAMISSVVANKNAKRAATIHLYFNIIGTIVFMVLLYSINAFVHFSFLMKPELPARTVLSWKKNIPMNNATLKFIEFLRK